VWLPNRLPDWGNPFFSVVVGEDLAEVIGRCGTAWLIERNIESAEYRARIANYCHKQLFCGICASSKSNERASTWLEHFRAANEALGLPLAGRSVYLTLPQALSEEIGGREDRRDVINALHRGIDVVMRTVGLLGWVKTTHFVSSADPRRPHLHFPIFYLAADVDGRALPGFLGADAFEALKGRFLGAWNGEVAKIVGAFGLQAASVSEVIHLAYYKDLAALEGQLRYELRPPMQDPMRHCTESAEQLREGVEMVLSFLYPPGAKIAFRRTRGGGVFGPRAITPFFQNRGYAKQDKVDENAGDWSIVGTAALLEGGREVCRFVIVGTGEVITVARAMVSSAAHGCPFVWVRSA
jgi:hypothetical protein